MAVLIECADCRRIQSLKNKLCGKCRSDLDKQKRSRRCHYWIDYKPPGGKAVRQKIGRSLKKAKDADSKRKVQRREKRIFDMVPGTDLTCKQLTDWYLKLEVVKRLASYERVRQCLDNFNEVFGHKLVIDIRPVDLENYQAKRERDGRAPATIDMEVSCAKTMVRKARNNKMVSADVVEVFSEVKRKLKKRVSGRAATLGIEQFLALLKQSPGHLKVALIIAYHDIRS